MPFCKVNETEKIEKKAAVNPIFKEAWESSQDEYTLLADIIRTRKSLKLSQKELARMSGCTQQEVSRLENHGEGASLRTLMKILNSMGYTLVLSKK